MDLFGIPIIIDFTEPLTQEEIDEASKDLDALVEAGARREVIEFRLAMLEAGYMMETDDNGAYFAPIVESGNL